MSELLLWQWVFLLTGTALYIVLGFFATKKIIGPAIDKSEEELYQGGAGGFNGWYWGVAMILWPISSPICWLYLKRKK